jgi:predicted metal-dependent phosphoesterase TrpH
VHTCYSDGSFEPREVVELAKKVGLQAIAITDHDTISGTQEAIFYGEKLGVEAITGIEFSAEVSCSKDTIHLLGYLFDFKNKRINDCMK